MKILNYLNAVDKIENPWAKLALAPIMGGLFLMFMPAIGFGLCMWAIAAKIIALTGNRTRTAALPKQCSTVKP